MQLLAPPLAANMLVSPLGSMNGTLALNNPLTDVESFPGTSGMYPSAEVKFAVLVGDVGGEVGCQNIEVGAADCDVEGRGCEPVDLETMLRLLLGIEIVAASGSGVASCDGDRDALRGGLFPKTVDELVSSRALERFASGEAYIENAYGIIVDGTVDGEEEA